MKSTMAEMKNTLNSIEGKLDISKEIIRETEDRIKTIQKRTQIEKIKNVKV